MAYFLKPYLGGWTFFKINISYDVVKILDSFGNKKVEVFETF